MPQQKFFRQLISRAFAEVPLQNQLFRDLNSRLAKSLFITSKTFARHYQFKRPGNDGDAAIARSCKVTNAILRASNIIEHNGVYFYARRNSVETHNRDTGRHRFSNMIDIFSAGRRQENSVNSPRSE